MKIDDVSKIYDFLGNISVPAFISMCILLSIAILILISPSKEGSKISTKLRLVLLVLVNLSLIVLYIDAKSKTKGRQLANVIKNDLVRRNFEQISFRNVILPDVYNDSLKKIKFLNDLVERFPEEFSIVKLVHLKDSTIKTVKNKDSIIVVNDNNPLDVYAIAIIDSKAIEKIDKQINERANRTAHLLVAIMNSQNINIINVNIDVNKPGIISLRQIDNEGWLIGGRFFNALIGRNDLQPIYDNLHNITAFTVYKK